MSKILTPTLIRALIVFVISLVLSVTVILVSSIYMEGVAQDKLRAQREMRKWQSKINSSVESNQIIEQFENNFLKLVNQGVVGSEDRLSWFENIQQTARARGLHSVKYGISTQQLLDEANLKRDYYGIEVFKSIMPLDMKMAHEGDLFAILNSLRRAGGLFAVDKCNMEKISKLSIETENNMKATCELGWYTFKGSKAK